MTDQKVNLALIEYKLDIIRNIHKNNIHADRGAPFLPDNKIFDGPTPKFLKKYLGILWIISSIILGSF